MDVGLFLGEADLLRLTDEKSQIVAVDTAAEPQPLPTLFAAIPSVASPGAPDPSPFLGEIDSDPAASTAVSSGRTTITGISLEQILTDRPDVLRAFFEQYYGPENDRHSSAWADRVGGESAEDYANFWYNTHGAVEGYRPSSHGDTSGQSRAAIALPDTANDRISAEGVNLDQILRDRPDVMSTYYRDYFGSHNDRHSSAWADRVGGTTVEDYANYWYKHHGVAEGYIPTMVAAPVASEALPDNDVSLLVGRSLVDVGNVIGIP